MTESCSRPAQQRRRVRRRRVPRMLRRFRSPAMQFDAFFSSRLASRVALSPPRYASERPLVAANEFSASNSLITLFVPLAQPEPAVRNLNYLTEINSDATPSPAVHRTKTCAQTERN